MKIVLIGTGNVAVVLSKKLKAAGHTIVQVFGRRYQTAAALAATCNAAACTEWSAITQDAELYIIAVSDKALAGNDIHLKLTDQLVVHTAGAVPMERLKDISSSYGVLYPFQTIRKEIEPLPDIPLMVDANTTAAKEQLLALAKTIAHKVIVADDVQRMQYHLCAVVTNNFSNYLYVLVETYCNKHGLDFSSLQPLIDETAHRLHRYSPRHVQTGPAARRDMVTIQHHLNLLDGEPALKHLYKILSDDILKYPW
jgi:predicted short-subunit dehydrogenase-like oxidoreductase (DUF2520 family)